MVEQSVRCVLLPESSARKSKSRRAFRPFQDFGCRVIRNHVIVRIRGSPSFLEAGANSAYGEQSTYDIFPEPLQWIVSGLLYV